MHALHRNLATHVLLTRVINRVKVKGVKFINITMELNAMGWGCQIYRGKTLQRKVYGNGSNFNGNAISGTRGWVCVKFPEKKRYVGLTLVEITLIKSQAVGDI